jgi:hypothetical protein
MWTIRPVFEWHSNIGPFGIRTRIESVKTGFRMLTVGAKLFFCGSFLISFCHKNAQKQVSFCKSLVEVLIFCRSYLLK